jgi:hypothetical protein
MDVVADTGPAVRQAPLVPPLPAGRYHCPAAVELFANVSLSSGEPAARAVVGISTATVAKTVTRHIGAFSRWAQAWREVRVG